MKQSCDTCKHGEFWRTPTGRPKRNEAGLCRFSLAVVEAEVRTFARGKLPSSCDACVNNIRIWNQEIWPTEGTECPVWEPKPKPQDPK